MLVLAMEFSKGVPAPTGAGHRPRWAGDDVATDGPAGSADRARGVAADRVQMSLPQNGTVRSEAPTLVGYGPGGPGPTASWAARRAAGSVSEPNSQ